MTGSFSASGTRPTISCNVELWSLRYLAQQVGRFVSPWKIKTPGGYYNHRGFEISPG